MPLALRVINGSLAGRVVPLFVSPFAIGREPDNQLSVDDPTMSRRHAVLSTEAGAWRIRDLASSRGTLRNGAPVPPHAETPLGVGDRLQIGETILEVVASA